MRRRLLYPHTGKGEGMSSEGTSACGCSCGTPKPLFDEPEEHGPWWKDTELMFPITAGVFCITGFVLDHTVSPTAALVCYWVALIAGGWTFIPGSLRQLVTNKGRSRMGVGLLMTIAAVGAVLLGHVGEAAALAFLFSISETLEDRAMDRAQQGLRALLSLMPNTARVVRDDVETTVPASEVRASDVLVVGAGDRVATDGTVIAGQSWLDTSAITGESIPVGVSPGSSVSAGSVNGSGTLRIRATSDGRDNSLTQIVRLVEQAQSAKGERARFADRVARPLVPAVLVASLLIVLFGFLVGDPATWTQRALVVLVAASPCAMAIAVPVTVISAVGAASKLGVVIKSGVAFEQLGTIQTVAFDKTGTLTKAKFEVSEFFIKEGVSIDKIYSLCLISNHQISVAVAEFLKQKGAKKVEFENTNLSVAKGVSADIAGERFVAGSRRFLAENGVKFDESEENVSFFVAKEGELVAKFYLKDSVKPEAKALIDELKIAGLATYILSGDVQNVVKNVADELGVSEFRAQMLPDEKAKFIAELKYQGKNVLMVGDGINDAAALSLAHVAICMGSGAAVSLEKSDVVLLDDSLQSLAKAVKISKFTYKTIKQNLLFCLLYNALSLPFAVCGYVMPLFAALFMSASSLSVILNSLFIVRKFKDK